MATRYLYYPGICPTATVERPRCKTKPRAEGGMSNHQADDSMKRMKPTASGRSSFSSKVLSLLISSLVYTSPDATFEIHEVASPDQIVSVYALNRRDDLEATFLVDSGAARHCCFQKHRFKNLRYGSFGCVKVANGGLVPIVACGDVDVRIGDEVVTLRSVMYVPDLTFNVISVKRLWKDNRLSTHFSDNCGVQCIRPEDP